ncbi:MAG: NAD(P)-dependent oxidoreductase [Crocinitomicaceae bacterium]|nr:NAD(P)-dependent oxidoreductase [Crocinitomicaceae bacterium]
MKKTVAIIGGGPSALAAAAFLNMDQFDVAIYEKNKTLGRKFLVAGKGGFNLTHSEEIEQMISKYSESPILASALRSFTNDDFRDWLKSIGIPTFVGSSKRVYPEKGIKPIEVLNKIMAILEDNSVTIEYEKSWSGFNPDGTLLFESGETISADIVVFSLGGASWKVTGSDGTWLGAFSNQGIETVPFLPANCAYQVKWKDDFLQKAEGQPLKNIALQCDGKRCKGELVITNFGLEGNAIYALSSEIQAQLTQKGKAIVQLDLKPMMTLEAVTNKLMRSEAKTTEILKSTLNLSKTQIHLLKTTLTKDEFLSKSILADSIKQLPIQLESTAPIDEAISTTGGISMNAINENFELKTLNGSYCIGEMLDWNAPTGGYLLQACFSMGAYLARRLNEKK